MNRLTTGYIRRLSNLEKSIIHEKTGQHYKWVLEGDAIWEKNNIIITVPKGFLTDGATAGPDTGNGWVFHDYIFSTHQIGGNPCTRKDADKIMIDILKWERFRWYPFVVKILVSLNPFWLFSRAWNNSGRRGAQFIHDYL